MILKRARESFELMITRLRREWSRTSLEPVRVVPTKPLKWAVERRSIAQLSETLSRGAEVNERFEEGQTALILAASIGWVDGVRLLLSKGADVHQRDDLGYTALQMAYWYGERTGGPTAVAFEQVRSALQAAGCPQ